jgi:hypothetical protein
MRSPATRDRTKYAKVSLSPHEIEGIAMTQEDKLAHAIRLEIVNASNKAVCLLLVRSTDFSLPRKFKLLSTKHINFLSLRIKDQVNMLWLLKTRMLD